jgi:hypothetical protein
MVSTGRGKGLLSWCVYLLDAPPTWLGTVEAATADQAVTIAAEKFGQESDRLIALVTASEQ